MDVSISNEIRRVFAAQQARRWTIAQTSAAQRIEHLRKLEKAVVARRHELAVAVHRDFRKSEAEFEITEIYPVLEEIHHAIVHLPRWMEPERVPATLVLAGTRSAIRSEPRGVVLIISPWNYPFNLLFVGLVGAIAAGNAIILKPSSKTANVSDVIARLIRDTFRDDEIAVFTGGHEIADALLELPFDHFMFSGSQRVGKKVMEAAIAHLASITLELGGKSPVIVDRSADIETAAARVMWGKCANAGQTCLAPDYALVPREQVDRFAAAARAAVERFYGATEEARKRSPDFARLIDDTAFRRVRALLETSIAGGARPVFGAELDASERYIAPTLLTGITPDMPIMAEEIFAPVLPVIAYDSLDEATALVRAHEKPLALYAFGRDRGAIERVLATTTSGGTVINDVLLQFVNPHLPYGGVGASGQGSYHGEHGFKAFSHARAVLDAPRSVAPALYPPYDTARAKIAAKLLRAVE